DRINKEDPLYLNVFQKFDERADFPYIKEYFRIQNRTNSQTNIILSSRKGICMFNRTRFKTGYIYCFAFPFSEKITNFTGHPLFIPSIYNIVLNSSNKTNEYYTIGINKIIHLSGIKYDNSCNLNITGINDLEFYPSYSLINNQLQIDIYNIKNAGNFRILCDKNNISGLSLNYNRIESIPDYYTVDELNDAFADIKCGDFSILDIHDNYLSKSIKHINMGISLWMYFILISILFLVFEVLIIRLFK
ncbi:MAG: hypothetical protein ABIJ97_15555, partial [Bacteroidota bacterium]